jgi:peptidoglycan/xylan/chitin deacetylase (PgdA/CDA1 family)
MLKQIKQAALTTAKAAGVFSLVQNSKWRRERLLILAYHGIAIDDEYQWNPALFMRQDHFRARLLMIKRLGYVMLPLSEALDRLYAENLPPKSLALTFDDGNYDFYKQAYPVLKEFGFPITLYLTTFYSYYNRPVFDVMIDYLLWKGRGATLNLKELTGQEEKLDLREDAARAKALAELHNFARGNKLSAAEKDDLSARLAKQLHIDYDELLQKRLLHIMRPEEVQQLAAAGVDIQLHTHRHRIPSEQMLFAREIEDNRKSIQAMTNSRPAHFCYPSGNCDLRFFPWLKELGVASATTCDPDMATRNSKPLLLPRLVDSSSLSPVEFEGWLTGISTFLPQRARG